MNKQTIILIIAIVLVLVSLGFNLYFLAWKNIEQKIMQRGAAEIVTFIVQQVKQNGQIQIEDLILVPVSQPQEQTEQPSGQE